MKNWKNDFLVAVLMILSYLAHSQNLPIESWRAHFSYSEINNIVFGNNTVLGAAAHGICYLDLQDNSINTFTKMDGLSGADITAIQYNTKHQSLIVGYDNGLVDIYKNGKMYTIRDYYKSSLLVSKRINALATKGDFIYVGCGLGIIEISLQNMNITGNFRSIGITGTDPDVQSLQIFDNRIFAITDNEVLFANMDQTLQDFNNWNHQLNRFRKYSHLTELAGEVYVLDGTNRIMKLNGEVWEPFLILNNPDIEGLLSDQQSLYLYSEHTMWKIENDQLVIVENFEHPMKTVAYQNGFWYGTKTAGIISPQGMQVKPNGPKSDNMNRVRVSGGKVFACYGLYPEDYENQIDSIGHDVYENYEWKHIETPGFYNISDVAFFNGHYYLSSIGFGLYDLTDQKSVSGLSNNLDGRKAIIPELWAGNKLYIPAYYNPNPLYILGKSGDIIAYDQTYFSSVYPTGVAVSAGNTVWMQTSFEDHSGVMVFNEDTQEHATIKTTDGLYSNTVTDIAIDYNDEAWIASLFGPSVFTEATYIFQDKNGIRPYFENRPLFDKVNITAIAADGGNRIWMCTDNGIYVFDNNLNTQLYHFNEENSPLPGNEIIELSYDPLTGEMFILTLSGLVSYRTNSSVGRAVHTEVNIFPNPVRPGYEGKVGITGLANNAFLKITDVNGKLVRSLTANGGAASWDLMDYNQQRVKSGVYILFSSSADGVETYIGKMAVVN